MNQNPSNLPPGLSFGRRPAPFKLPRMDYPRVGGPTESQPTRMGEVAPEGLDGSAFAGEHLIASRHPEAAPPTTPWAPPPAATTGLIGGTPSSYTASYTASPTPIPISTSDPAPFASAILRQGAPSAPIQLGDPAPTITVKEESPRMMTSSGAMASIPDAREAAKVIVYGRSGSAACMRAIQDLMERQVSFQYIDVSRDQAAATHLTAICNGEPVVPVIVHIGFGGA